jgi:ABC-type nitrate/sulfonate/bicarbonate transport system ATPase subunit
MRAKGAMKAEGVELSRVEFGFGDLEVLRDVSLRAEPGEVLGIVGPSGCGKSTLLEIVAGLREPSAGAAAVGGEREGRVRHVALMPQRDCLLPWLSACDNAGLAPRNRGASRAQAREEARPLLERFGLWGFAAAAPHELSGGMRQRVAFARTLLAGKPVIVLDEPFASLDAITRAEMQEWLAQAMAQEARTAVLVSHDVEEALYLSDRVLVMSRRPGRILAEVPSPAPRHVPRAEAVTGDAFVGARARATETLGAGG